MQELARKAYAEIVATAASYIRKSTEKYLPDSAQKHFMQWILADNSHYQNDYLKMLGVASSIELEISMLNNIVNDEAALQRLSPYLGFLNAYFGFETIQDNIAIGLASWFQNDNPSRILQHTLIKDFNSIMITKLHGDSTPAAKLLAPYIDVAEKISAYERCLSPTKMYEFAHEYQKQYKDSTLLFKLEHCFYPILLLNIETCVDLLQSLQKHYIYDHLKEALIARYTSVNKLLSSTNTTSDLELADLGAKTILVLPTLVYCIGALDIISPSPVLEEVINDGSLMQGIYSSALLVRLLNDIGTNLLTLTENKRSMFFKDIFSISKTRKFNSIVDLLLFAGDSAKLNGLMGRIRKDIKYGEFNICLDNISDIHDIPHALHEFCNKITFYSNLYQQYQETLNKTCGHLEKKFGDAQISKFIFNMFKFHEKMYSIEFESTYGDYAILSEGVGANEKLN